MGRFAAIAAPPAQFCKFLRDRSPRTGASGVLNAAEFDLGAREDLLLARLQQLIVRARRVGFASSIHHCGPLGGEIVAGAAGSPGRAAS